MIPVTIDSGTTAKQMLAMLDSWLDEAEPDERNRLWSIISAFRGPDKDDFTGQLKMHTTAKIRLAALPKVARKLTFPIIYQEGVTDEELRELKSTPEYGHFDLHVVSAAVALLKLRGKV